MKNGRAVTLSPEAVVKVAHAVEFEHATAYVHGDTAEASAKLKKLIAQAPSMAELLEWYVQFEGLVQSVGDMAPGSHRANKLADARRILAALKES